MSERVYPTYNTFNDIEERRGVTSCVKYKYGRESVIAMLQNLCWEELLQRRIRAQVLMLYKINKALFTATPLIMERHRAESEATTHSANSQFLPEPGTPYHKKTPSLVFRSALDQVTLDVNRIYLTIN